MINKSFIKMSFDSENETQINKLEELLYKYMDDEDSGDELWKKYNVSISEYDNGEAVMDDCIGEGEKFAMFLSKKFKDVEMRIDFDCYVYEYKGYSVYLAGEKIEDEIYEGERYEE